MPLPSEAEASDVAFYTEWVVDEFGAPHSERVKAWKNRVWAYLPVVNGRYLDTTKRLFSTLRDIRDGSLSEVFFDSEEAAQACSVSLQVCFWRCTFSSQPLIPLPGPVVQCGSERGKQSAHQAQLLGGPC